MTSMVVGEEARLLQVVNCKITVKVKISGAVAMFWYLVFIMIYDCSLIVEEVGVNV